MIQTAASSSSISQPIEVNCFISDPSNSLAIRSSLQKISLKNPLSSKGGLFLQTKYEIQPRQSKISTAKKGISMPASNTRHSSEKKNRFSTSISPSTRENSIKLG